MKLSKMWWATYWSVLFLVTLLFVAVTVIKQPVATTTTTSPYSLTVRYSWTKADSLAYAHDAVIKDAQAQFACLSNLWGKESAWDAKAHNKTRVMGKTAGGIPQLLGMSPLVPPTLQIERGLSYIYFRYTTPCNAWKYWQQKGWY